MGVLTELAPHEQPHLLGLNVNARQAIELRLRTDTYDGSGCTRRCGGCCITSSRTTCGGERDNNVSAVLLGLGMCMMGG